MTPVDPEVELVYRVDEFRYTEGHKPTEFVKRFHVLLGASGAVAFGYIARPEDDTNILELERKIGHPMWPMGLDVGRHSRVRLHEWDTVLDCEWLPGGKCHYDGSSLRATEWLDTFQRAGEGWLKGALRAYYRETFEGVES